MTHVKHGSVPAALLLCAALAGMFASCTRIVDFSGELPGPKLVVNCFVNPDSVVRVHVSRSWNIAETGGEALTDATVLLYVNDELQPPDARSPAWPSYLSHAALGEGDRVRLVVAAKGYDEASAETTVPPKTPILAVDTARFGDRSMRFFIRLKDVEAGMPNRYRLDVSQEYLIDGEWHVASSSGIYSGVGGVFDGGRFDYEQDAALLAEFEDVNSDILGTSDRNIFGLFSDDLFDGREYTLNVSLHPMFMPDSYSFVDGMFVPDTRIAGMRYTFRLVTLSQSAYRYLKTLTIQENSGEENVFTEPSAVYCNIAGGLGILGAFRTDAATVRIPDDMLSQYPWFDAEGGK
ncbi:MAG: DUF4249 domain-containing protein [Tannerella sp.]|nr:DUF4249 domain-containing protein [Tannerella sp.]